MATVFSDFTVSMGGFVRLDSYLDITNHPLYLEGYQLWDGEGSNSFQVNGQFVDATDGYYISKDLVDDVLIYAADMAGMETLYARAWYNGGYQDWDAATMTTTSGGGGNVGSGVSVGGGGGALAPTVSIGDLALGVGEWEYFADNVNWQNDNGAPTWYEIWDSEGGNSFWVEGIGVVDASAGLWLTAQQMSTLWVQGESSSGSQTLWVRAYDTEAGPWESFTLTTTSSNAPPVLSIDDITLGVNAWEYFADNVNWNNDDGAPTWYQIFDNDGSNSFWLEARNDFVDASNGLWLTASEMAGLWLKGESSNEMPVNGDSQQTLWIQAYDTEAGPWESFVLTTDNPFG